MEVYIDYSTITSIVLLNEAYPVLLASIVTIVEPAAAAVTVKEFVEVEYVAVAVAEDPLVAVIVAPLGFVARL